MPISSNCFNIFLILCSEAEILTIELWQIFFKMEKKINKKWPWRPSSRKQPSAPNNNIPTLFAFRVFCEATPKTIANRPINGGGAESSKLGIVVLSYIAHNRFSLLFTSPRSLPSFVCHREGKQISVFPLFFLKKNM